VKRIGLIFALLLGATDGMAQGAAPPPDSPAEVQVDTAPVVVDGRELFSVAGVPSHPASRRAGVIAGRIRDLARSAAFDPATITMTPETGYTQISANGRLLMRLTDEDAEIDGLDRHLLAEMYVADIRDAISAYRAGRTRDALISSAWRAALATLLAVLALFVVWRVAGAVTRWVARRFGHRVKTVSVSSFEVVRRERIWGFIQGLLRFAGGLSLVACVVLYLRYTLALFPWTRGAATHLDDWVLAPLAVLGSGLVAKIPNLVFLVVLFFVARYLLRLINLFFSAVGRGDVQLKNFDPDWAQPTYNIVRVGVVVFALIVAYPYIPGSSSAAFKGVSLLLGVIVSLGSSSVISNLIAGYTMIYRRAFRVGDVVKIGDVRGAVTQVRLQVTHVRTPKNEEIVVPNSTILSSEVINFTSLAKSDGLILNTTVGIGYETPWRQVEAMLLEAARRTPGLLKEPVPFVLATALGDFAVTYQLNAYCDDPRGMLARYSDLHRNILDVFNEYGVQIMTPAYEGDPDAPKIVPPAKWHLPPARKP
jgi:small-conductance mechanosensitive channel